MYRLLFLFLLSMVPVIELRGAVPIGIGWGYPFWLVYLVCVVGNLLPVPVLIPFAGRVLRWGAGLPRVGGLFRKILSIGEKRWLRQPEPAGQSCWRCTCLWRYRLPGPAHGAAR